MEIRPFRYWWLLAAKGIFAIIFGIIALAFPGSTIFSLLVFFGFLALFGGISLLTGSQLQKMYNKDWWLWFCEGIIDTGLGILFIIFPFFSARFFFPLIASWIFIMTILRITGAFRAKKNALLFLIISICSISVAGLLLVKPFETAIILVILIGSYTIVYGVSLLIHSLSLRSVLNQN